MAEITNRQQAERLLAQFLLSQKRVFADRRMRNLLMADQVPYNAPNAAAISALETRLEHGKVSKSETQVIIQVALREWAESRV